MTANLDPSMERASDARFFVDLDEGAVVLDCLSLEGRLAARLAEGGAKVVCLVSDRGKATDVVRALAPRAAKCLRTVCGDPERLPFRDAAFDCVFDVALHSDGEPGSLEAVELGRVLKDSGSLVWGRLSERRFASPQRAAIEQTTRCIALEGKRTVSTYCVIPSARDPRAYLPLDGANRVSAYTRFFSERFFSAESVRSKLLRWLAMRPSLAGMLVRHVPSRLMVAAARGGEAVGPKRVLRETAGVKELDVFLLSGVWRGADVASSAVFIGFEKSREEPTALVKVSRSPAHNKSLDHEFDKVSSIRERVGPAAAESIPRPLGRAQVQRSRAAVYEWAGGRVLSHVLKTARPRERMRVFERVFCRAAGFLVEIFRHTRREGAEPALPLGDRDATAAQVVELAAAESRLGLTKGMIDRLRGMAAEGVAGVSCLGHGDFAPCNVQIEGGKIWVLDWELGADGRTPMFDLATFLAHSFEDIRPADSGLGLLAEAFEGVRRKLSVDVHRTISMVLSVYGIDRIVWKRFFALYCASEMLRDLLYFRLGTAPFWRAALNTALEVV